MSKFDIFKLCSSTKMLSPALRRALDKILLICQNTGIYSTHYCSLIKMEEQKPKWEIEKIRLLAMSSEERLNRGIFKNKEIINVNMVDPWNNYAIRHNKVIQTKKHTLDDLSEFRRMRMDKTLDAALSQKVSIYKGDITTLEVSAVVNAANSLLRAGGGVDGAIHRAAGPLLQDECNTIGGCPTGEARITGGYNLPAKYVIHTVGPQDGCEEKLLQCYENSLAFQKKYKLTSIAFPCISTGIYSFPNRLAAHIALRTARRFLEGNDDLERIIFCLFMPIDVDIYETLMQMYFPVHDWNYNDGTAVSE